MSDRFARALAGYDDEFRHRLVEAIFGPIATESIIIDGDTRVLALRTAETCDALAIVFAPVMAMNPDFDVPSRLREETKTLAKRIRRDVAQARAAGTFDRVGAARGGCA